MTVLKEYIEEITQQVVSEKIRSLKKDLRFDFKEFKAIEWADRKILYAKARLQKLGCGSSRCAYALSSGKVLKISRHRREAEQNEAEIKAFARFGADFVPRIYDHDLEFEWLVVEPSRTFSSFNELKKITGITEYDLIGLEFQVVQNGASSLPEAIDNYNKITTGNRIVFDQLPEKGRELLSKFYHLVSQGMDDISRWDHWGWTSDQKIVCVDPGLTR